MFGEEVLEIIWAITWIERAESRNTLNIFLFSQVKSLIKGEGGGNSPSEVDVVLSVREVIDVEVEVQ